MAYIYMDESGDLGFSGKEWTSKYFIITFLLSSNTKDMELIMKNVRKWAAWKHSKLYGSFYHATKENQRANKRVLDLASRRELQAFSIIAEKDKVPMNLRKDVHSLYNYMVWELLDLSQKRWFLPKWEKNIFVASRRETNKQLNSAFMEHIKSKKYDLYKFDYIITAPNQMKGLEVVDAISFSLHQKYEFKEFELYSVIKNKIILEKQIFN